MNILCGIAPRTDRDIEKGTPKAPAPPTEANPNAATSKKGRNSENSRLENTSTVAGPAYITKDSIREPSREYSPREVSSAYHDALNHEYSNSNSVSSYNSNNNSNSNRNSSNNDSINSTTASQYEYKPYSIKSTLPPNWQRYFDKKSQSYYYYNTKTQKTSWEHPKGYI